MSVNEKIDEPISTARARVQSTCRVIAVAPETAKAASAARRGAGVDDAAAGGSGAGVQLGLGGGRVEPLVQRSAPLARRRRRGSSRRASRIAAASVRLKRRR